MSSPPGIIFTLAGPPRPIGVCGGSSVFSPGTPPAAPVVDRCPEVHVQHARLAQLSGAWLRQTGSVPSGHQKEADDEKRDARQVHVSSEGEWRAVMAVRGSKRVKMHDAVTQPLNLGCCNGYLAHRLIEVGKIRKPHGSSKQSH
jgi:hypothetical protein